VTCREAELKVTPYINDELTDEELKDFIGHIRSCPSCRDELEMYYTIYKTLNVLDSNEAADISDISRQLETDLQRKEKTVEHHRKAQDAFGILIMLAEILLLVCILMTHFGNGEAFFAQFLKLIGF